MRLVACPKCHLQYDVTQKSEATFVCSCGATVHNVAHGGVDAVISRCGSCGATIGNDAERCDYCQSVVVRDHARLSLICPECYSRNAEDSRFCTSCGVEFRPVELPDAQQVLECPACALAMEVRSIGGVTVRECGKCNGLWVPEDHFDTLVKKAIEAQKNLPSSGLATWNRAKPVEVAPRVQYRRCPVCKGPMLRKNFGRRSGVIVDWCGEHGTWLDADELEEIARFILAGGLLRQSAARQATVVADGSQHHTQEQVEALLLAEKWMAEERLRQESRRSRFEQGLEIHSLGDLLDFFLRR